MKLSLLIIFLLFVTFSQKTGGLQMKYLLLTALFFSCSSDCDNPTSLDASRDVTIDYFFQAQEPFEIEYTNGQGVLVVDVIDSRECQRGEEDDKSCG